MINLLFWRELIAQFLFIFDLALGAMLLHYLAEQARTFERWWRRPAAQAAMAILTLVLGQTMVRLWSIVIFAEYRHGVGIFDLENRYPMALLGTAIAVIGLCWCIRIFSPDKWREKGWIAACVVGLLFVIVMHLVS
jgi:hypothetical protein